MLRTEHSSCWIEVGTEKDPNNILRNNKLKLCKVVDNLKDI